MSNLYLSPWNNLEGLGKYGGRNSKFEEKLRIATILTTEPPRSTKNEWFRKTEKTCCHLESIENHELLL